MDEEFKEQSEDMDLSPKTSLLEEAAEDRKRRLREMKKQMQNPDAGKKLDDNANVPLVLFRSYDPISENLGLKKKEKDLSIVESVIQDQLADTEDTNMVNEVDVGVLAPRKVDWDLKRDISEKKKKFDRRREKATANLIRERLAKGEVELSAVVNSGAYLQVDE